MQVGAFMSRQDENKGIPRVSSTENYKVPEDFQCARCGACCEWEGYVRLTDDEVDVISEFLGMSVETFTSEYTRLTDDRRSLSLIENDDGSCVFYEKSPPKCLINDVKPVQCVNFPRVWNFDGWEERCAGARRDQRD
jgi:Fe-S-cluster containining protein